MKNTLENHSHVIRYDVFGLGTAPCVSSSGAIDSKSSTHMCR
jgi:hypothetical protein